MNWRDKVVFITGASSGIGRALAVELARRGAKVGLLARRSEMLQAVVAEIQEGDGQALVLPADVRDASAVKGAAERLRSEFGRIDVLIANAGVGGKTLHASVLDPQDVARVMEINVLGAVNSVAAVLPDMIKRDQGQLVAISSLSAYRGLPKSAAYCASKAAVSAFFESMRIDLMGSNVDVTIIYPGFIKTDLTAGRKAKLPYLMELDYAVKKIIQAIERKRKSYSFPWQLASIVRAGLIMPNDMYDRIAGKRSYRE
jgi:short-subunit dehydrogenase